MKRNSHPVKVVEVKDYEGLYANSHPYKVEVEGGGGGEYSDFTGATEISAGEHGLVPAPKAGEQNKYLKGDGTWAEVSGGGGSGIPTDATFWGASYDSVNNKVDGDITLSLASDPTKKAHVSLPGDFGGDAASVEIGAGASTGYSSRVVISSSELRFYQGSNYIRFRGSNGLSMKSLRINSLADPTNPQDAATKNYVDTAVASAGAATYTPSEFNNLWENA